MKIFSESHKTVFVVDHCPYMAESCRQHVEFDMLVKNRTQGIIPLAPISKSLWTCSVESSMEYCRIMYDIFPFKKLVNFIVSDSGARVLNSWTQEDQNLQELMAALAAVGPPNPRADPECCSILHGLVAAVEALCKITEYQHEARTMLMENAERVGNRGRIICITNAKSDSHVRMLEDYVQETIHEHNKLAANSDHLMQIQKCELVLIHTYPVGEDSLVSDRPKKELSPVLTSEVHSVRAGRHLATKLNVLVQQHFDLASTTITNIPMKEEQHANTSANYDVELLHHKEAHVDFLKSEMSCTIEKALADAKALVERLREHDNAAEALIEQTTALNKRVEAMKQYQEEIQELNEVARHRPRSTLVMGIQQENRQIRELQQENKELRTSLEEHQSALELIMSKYREQMFRLLMASKKDDPSIIMKLKEQHSKELQVHVDQITEMAAVMRKAIEIDDKHGCKEQERIIQLEQENKGLREILQITRESFLNLKKEDASESTSLSGLVTSSDLSLRKS